MENFQANQFEFDPYDFLSEAWVSYAKAAELMTLCNIHYYELMEILMDLSMRMNHTEFLHLLGEWWTRCDTIGYYQSDLEDYVFSNWKEYRERFRKMMTGMEQTAYDALPESVTIYRGCYKSNKQGLSWTLSRELAGKYPFFLPYRQQGQPLLLTAKVDKEDIIALKHSHGEATIITTRPKQISTLRLKKTPLVV